MICLCEYLTRAGYARPAGCAALADGMPENVYGIRILECRSLDSLAVLPDEINGLSVVELAPYLFSVHGSREDDAAAGTFWWSESELEKPQAEIKGAAAEQSGESAAGRLEELAAGQPMEPSTEQMEKQTEAEQTEDLIAGWEKESSAEPESNLAAQDLWHDIPPLRGGRLEELRLPARLEKVGAYALYNCEKLKKLELYSTTLDWGAGVFAGCYGVEQVTIHADESRKSCMREVLAELRQTLEVLYLPEKAADETEVQQREALPAATALSARLIFPEFFEEAVENTPARILVTETHGCGQKYRNAFVSTQFQFREYDSLFPHIQVQEPETLVARLALGRLMYPYRLEERYAERYREYLEEHAAAAAGWAVENGDMQALEWIFAHISCGGEMIAGLLDVAGACHNGAAVSFLMNRRREAGAVTRKRFSL